MTATRLCLYKFSGKGCTIVSAYVQEVIYCLVYVPGQEFLLLAAC